MKIDSAYAARKIRFLEIYPFQKWNFKLYSISVNEEYVSDDLILIVKENLGKWLSDHVKEDQEHYKTATLIIHEGNDGVYVILNWWFSENMLQNYVYQKKYKSNEFFLISHEGVVACVWELAVWWHERNAWVKHVLRKNKKPDFQAYLNDYLQTNI